MKKTVTELLTALVALLLVLAWAIVLWVVSESLSASQ